MCPAWDAAAGRAGAISAMPVFLRSAELLYEPSERRSLGTTMGAVAGSAQSGGGRALRYDGAPRPPPTPEDGDISKWQ